VKGATEVELTQFGRIFDTHDVIPFVVWRPSKGEQLAQAVKEVKVRQFEADALTQLDELNRNNPTEQAEQVKLAE
jgi:alkyl hydroperoxide reductase subunit AhpF